MQIRSPPPQWITIPCGTGWPPAQADPTYHPSIPHGFPPTPRAPPRGFERREVMSCPGIAGPGRPVGQTVQKPECARPRTSVCIVRLLPKAPHWGRGLCSVTALHHFAKSRGWKSPCVIRNSGAVGRVRDDDESTSESHRGRHPGHPIPAAGHGQPTRTMRPVQEDHKSRGRPSEESVQQLRPWSRTGRRRATKSSRARPDAAAVPSS